MVSCDSGSEHGMQVAVACPVKLCGLSTYSIEIGHKSLSLDRDPILTACGYIIFLKLGTALQ